MHYLLILLFSLFSESERTLETPNIIIIFFDDMGYGDLGCYGHPTIRTPHMDRLASNGIKFTNFYSGSPACTASRYALLTGKYPIESGFGWVLYPNSERGIHQDEETLAEILKDNGYKTSCIGKWHLGSTRNSYLPLQNGFDEYFGLPYSNDMIPPRRESIPLYNGNDTLELDPDQTWLTKKYTEKAVNFIKDQNDNPFFLYIPHAMPHIPLHRSPAFQDTSARGLYGDVIEELDWSVGQIIETLKSEGLWNNTILWVISDNGPWIIKNEQGGSSGLLRDGKGSTWEGGMRVPSLLHWPGKNKEFNLMTAHTSVLDIFETLSRFGNRSQESRKWGRDLSDYLRDGSGQLTEVPFFYYGLSNRLFAVRKGPWKLHIETYSQTGIDYFEGELPLLFHLDQDPSEKYNVAEIFPEIVSDLQIELANHQKEISARGNYWD